jgi:predicted nucleotidyltransferase
MSSFAEYVEAWKERDRLLEEKVSLLRENLMRTLPDLSRALRALGAEEVIIFGSLVEGDFRYGSDIDIAVKDLTESKYLDAIIAVEKILAPLDINFDLVLYERAYPWIRKKIDQVFHIPHIVR